MLLNVRAEMDYYEAPELVSTVDFARTRTPANRNRSFGQSRPTNRDLELSQRLGKDTIQLSPPTAAVVAVEVK